MEDSQVPSEEGGLSALIDDSQVPSEGISELAADDDDEVLVVDSDQETFLFGPPAPDDGDDGRRGHMYIIYL